MIFRWALFSSQFFSILFRFFFVHSFFTSTHSWFLWHDNVEHGRSWTWTLVFFFCVFCQEKNNVSTNEEPSRQVSEANSLNKAGNTRAVQTIVNCWKCRKRWNFDSFLEYSMNEGERYFIHALNRQVKYFGDRVVSSAVCSRSFQFVSGFYNDSSVLKIFRFLNFFFKIPIFFQDFLKVFIQMSKKHRFELCIPLQIQALSLNATLTFEKKRKINTSVIAVIQNAKTTISRWWTHGTFKIIFPKHNFFICFTAFPSPPRTFSRSWLFHPLVTHIFGCCIFVEWCWLAGVAAAAVLLLASASFLWIPDVCNGPLSLLYLHGNR